MNKKDKPFASQNLVEILSISAIICMLIVGGIAGYRHTIKQRKLNHLRHQILQVVTNAEAYYFAHGDFKNLTTEKALEKGIIPEDMKIDDVIDGNGKIIKHIYNGEFLVKGEINSADNKPMFTVIIKNLPKDAAIDISTAIWSDSDEVLQVKLNNNKI